MPWLLIWEVLLGAMPRVPTEKKMDPDAVGSGNKIFCDKIKKKGNFDITDEKQIMFKNIFGLKTCGVADRPGDRLEPCVFEST